MQKLFLSLALCLILAGTLSFPLVSRAASSCPANTYCFDLSTVNPLLENTFQGLVCSVAGFLQKTLMPPIAVLMVLWASFLYLTAAGQPSNVNSAKQVLVYTIVGAGILVLAPALLALVLSVFNGTSGGTPQSCNAAMTQDTFLQVLANLINWFSWFLATLSVAMGLYAGFLYMTSGGDPRKAEIAGKTIFYAVIGVIVSILAFSILSFINGFIA